MNNLPIFEVLECWDKKDYNVYDKFDKEELDNFVAYPALLWMSGASSDGDHIASILMTNEVNKFYFHLSPYKEIQTKLLAYAGLGEKVRHVYYKPCTSRNRSALNKLVWHYYPTFDSDDCDMFLQGITVEELKELIDQSGLYDDVKSAKRTLASDFKKKYKAG